MTLRLVTDADDFTEADWQNARRTFLAWCDIHRAAFEAEFGASEPGGSPLDRARHLPAEIPTTREKEA